MSNIIKDGEITKEFSVYKIGEGVDYLPAGRGTAVPCPDAEGSEGAWATCRRYTGLGGSMTVTELLKTAGLGSSLRKSA